MNDFKKDLLFSQGCEDNEIWLKIYNKSFPGYRALINNREDGELQRHGIDRTVVLNNGKAVYIDEKVRRGKYNDILLEYIANDRYKTLGWVEKSLFCDFIAYAILPSNVCYILPVVQLQNVWSENKQSWIKTFGSIVAKNKNYNTLNCPVPVNLLFKKIGESLRIYY